MGRSCAGGITVVWTQPAGSICRKCIPEAAKLALSVNPIHLETGVTMRSTKNFSTICSAGLFLLLSIAASSLSGCSGDKPSLNNKSSNIAVQISPTVANIAPGAIQVFTASLNGSATTSAVSWAVTEGSAGGSVSNAGLYTAPAVVGTYHVVATSVADSTKSATATVNVGATSASLQGIGFTPIRGCKCVIVDDSHPGDDRLSDLSASTTIVARIPHEPGGQL